jgi:sRNA-binding regulator protein Hfq
MLKVTNKKSIILEGTFEDYDNYVEIVEESDFAVLIIKADITDFEYKTVQVTDELAKHKQQYGKDYVICRLN